ncbi:unnamed protein product, partial [Cladocopium goreaui]
ATRRSWRHLGLVEQDLLSAAMTKVVMDWPFILDPQMQARRWLLAELGREMPALEVKACDPDLDQKIQRGIAAESSIVVKDCGALAPSVRLEMRPRLKRTTGGIFGEALPAPQTATPATTTSGSPHMGRRLSTRKINSAAKLSTNSLKDPTEPSNMRSFQIFMISSLSSCRELLPVTLQHCSVVNFALDLEALTQVFQDVLLKSQVPAFEQEFIRLYTLQMDDSALQKAEDRLLQFLDDHRGASILEGEDTVLVLSLYQEAQKQSEAFHSKFRKDLEDFLRCRARLKLFAEPWALATQSAMVLSTLNGFYTPSIPQISTKLQQIMTGNLVSKVAETGRHEKEPAFALRKALLLEVLQLLAQPMEEVHRLPLVFLTAVGLAHSDGTLTEHQLQIFWEGHKAVESVASAMNAEILRETAATGQVPQLINPRFIKSSPDRKTFPGEKWELINFLPHVFPGFHGLPQETADALGCDCGAVRGNATNATTASFRSDIGWIQVLGLLQDGQQQRLQVHVTQMNRLAATAWPRSLQIFGQELDLIAKNTMLAALALQHFWQQSLEFLEEMEDKDVISFSSTMDACGKASRWQLAVNQGVTGCKRSMRVDKPFFNIKLGALEKGQQWRRAADFFRCLSSQGLEAGGAGLTSCATALIRSQQWHRGLAICQAGPWDGEKIWKKMVV